MLLTTTVCASWLLSMHLLAQPCRLLWCYGTSGPKPVPTCKGKNVPESPELAVQWHVSSAHFSLTSKVPWPRLILKWWWISTTLCLKGEEQEMLLSKLNIYHQNTYMKNKTQYLDAQSAIILICWNGLCYARNN